MSQQQALMPASWLSPGGLEADEELRDVRRPAKRSECPERDEDGKRWCPWVGCRYHCALNEREDTGELQVWEEQRAIGRPGAVARRWRRREDEQQVQERAVAAIDTLVERYGSPCSLDWAEEGWHQLTEVGERLGCGEWSAHMAYSAAMDEVVEAVAAELPDVLLALASLSSSCKR